MESKDKEWKERCQWCGTWFVPQFVEQKFCTFVHNSLNKWPQWKRTDADIR